MLSKAILRLSKGARMLENSNHQAISASPSKGEAEQPERKKALALSKRLLNTVYNHY
jgi:hypothetical protein